MKHIKIFEKYELDFDSDIGEEYAKLIISTYIDKKNDETLESVYCDIIKKDKLAEYQEYIVKNILQDYLYELFEKSKEITNVIEIETKKYNI